MAKIRYRQVERRRSFIVYSVLFLLTFLTLIIADYRQPGDFSWKIFLTVLIGFIAIGFQRQAGFPELLQPTISNSFRFVYPLLTGLLFALPDILLIRFMQNPGPYEALSFPFSLLNYITDAIYAEVYFHLILFTGIMTLARNYLAVQYHTVIFWTVAVLTALWEPLVQWPQGPSWLAVYCLLAGFTFHLIQAWYYKKAGLLAALSVRLGYYLLWHTWPG